MLDSTSNANHATAQGAWGSTQQIVGKIDGALNFMSSNGDYLSTANLFASPGPQTETIEIWFNSTSTSGTKLIGFENTQTGTGSGSYDRQIWLGTNGKIYRGFYSCTYPGSLVSTSTYNDGNWHQVVLSLDTTAQQAKLYVDGVQVGSTIACSGSAAYSGYFRIPPCQHL
jgi:trimeric autotransporter adhesin